MRRFICAAAFFLMSLCFADRMSAGNFGVLGGANFYSLNVKGLNSQSVTQWHAGVTYKFNLPLGFHVQPSVIYNVKGTQFGVAPADLSVGYLELMASLQWGLDLILFRPFVDVSPFAGYGINGSGSLKEVWKSDADKFEYGVGIGGGMDIWRFQIAARYNWNFGNLLKTDIGFDSLRNANFSGVTVSLAYFF